MSTLIPPSVPTFRCIDDERLHRKQRLAAVFRLCAQYGLDEGISGHVTVRDPELRNCFWVNPFGLFFGHIRASDLVLMNEKGEVIEGDKPVNVSASATHSPIYAARPDVEAAVHVHGTYGKAWSTLGRLLSPISQEACLFYDDHSLFKSYSGLVEDSQEGEQIAVALGSHKAAILQNHGLLTVGQSIDEAAWWFILLERCCQVQLLAEATGHPLTLIEPDTARLTCRQLGTHYEGWFSFQPLYDSIVSQQADLLH